MAYPRLRRSRQMKKARRTSGNITLNSTSWANVDTGLDMTLKECQVGDEIEYGMAALIGSEAVVALFDVVTVVSGTPTNSFAERAAVVATPGAYLPAWRADSGRFQAIAGSAPLYTVVAGDLTGGEITLRLRYATVSAANRTLHAAATTPLDVWVENIGPAQG